MAHTVDVLLERLNITVEDLQSATGISQERISAIVDGRWTPTPNDRAQIAAALGVAVEEISWGHTINPRNVRYHRYGLSEDLNDVSE